MDRFFGSRTESRDLAKADCEDAEAERIRQFLADSDPAAVEALERS